MCKHLILAAAIFPALLAAQSTLTLSGPANVRPGQSATLALTLTAPVAPVGLQWTVAFPPALGTATVSSSVADKTLHSEAGKSLLIGLNTTPIAAGAVAQYALTVPPTATPGVYQVGLSGLIAADALGDVIPIVSGAVYEVTVLTDAVLPPSEISVSIEEAL